MSSKLTFPEIGDWAEELPTPCLIIDEQALDSNLKNMADHLKDTTMKVRPHYKSYKIPQIAKKQMNLGACGICCAKVGEAETLAGVVNDVLIANQVVTKNAIQRAIALLDKMRLIIAVDNVNNSKILGTYASDARNEIEVFIEVNIGMNRGGVLPEDPTVDFAKSISRIEGLKLSGIMGYEGHIIFTKDFEERKAKAEKCYKKLVDSKNALEKAGFECEIISAGGTGTYNIASAYDGLDELQAGSYTLMDVHYTSINPLLPFKQASWVLSTVCSTPVEGMLSLDAGVKTLGVDQGNPVLPKGLNIGAFSEEHIQCFFGKKLREKGVKVGDKFLIAPNHGCTTMNLHKNAYILNDGKIKEIWEVGGALCSN